MEAGAARRRDAPTVDFEQLLGDAELRVGLLEGVDGFPVQGQAMAVEQARLREDETAGVDGTEGHAFVVQPS